MQTSSHLRLTIAAIVLAAVASPAVAQGFGPYADGSVYVSPARENVYVRAPRHPRERGFAGEPVEDLSISRAVRYDDLDLRTAWGAHALEERVLYTASRLCRQLNQFYPTTLYLPTADSKPCYGTAAEEAMDQADAAIARARGY